MKSSKEIGNHLQGSYSLALAGSATLLLCYFKVESTFVGDWELIFLPVFLLFLKNVVIGAKKLISELVHEEEISGNIGSQIIILTNTGELTLSILSGLLLFSICDFLGGADQDAPEATLAAYRAKIYIYLGIILVGYLIYSWLLYRLQEVYYSDDSLLPLHHSAANTFGVVSTTLNTIFSMLTSLLTTTFFVCSGGSCHTLYVSTLSSFLSAVGLSVLDWMPYLNGLTFLFLLIGLLSLYIKNKSFKHKPFLLGLISATSIITSILFYESRLLLYGGNLGMIVAAIWNGRSDQPTLSFPKKKANKV
jgi:hypothetical protein